MAVAEVPAQVIVKCGLCGRTLDENPGGKPDDRRPCRRCGSKRRRVEIGLDETVHVTASLAIEIIRKDVIEKHWIWLAALLTATVASALVGGLVVSGWVSVIASLAFAAILSFIGLRAVKAVRRIEKFPSD